METIAVDIDEVLCPSSKDHLFDGAASCLDALKEDYNLEIITARNPRRIAETVGWLAMQLPDVFSGVHFTRRYRDEPVAVTKARICQDIGAGYLIDDLPEHVNIAAEAGIVPILFSRESPDDIHPNVIHVSDWEMIFDFFLKKVLTENIHSV